MITAAAQRWRSGRASYRPAGEVIEPRHYEVAPISADTAARAFVVEHHYSGSYPAARERVGLYRGGELVGVAVFSAPGQPRVLDALPCDRAAAVAILTGTSPRYVSTGGQHAVVVLDGELVHDPRVGDRRGVLDVYDWITITR